jgi:dTDP-4-amino-4,6-dideoxygalactose transaminase
MGDMQGSRFAFEYCLTLPLYHEMTNEEQGYIVQQLVMTIEDCR